MTVAHDIPPERIALLHAIRDRHVGQSGATQRERMREALETLGSVSTFEAMRHLDIFDPRPRKLELLREGLPIITLRQHQHTEAGERHRIGLYVLRKGARS